MCYVTFAEYHDVVVATSKNQKIYRGIIKTSRSKKATTRVLNETLVVAFMARSETKSSTLEYDQNSLVLCLVAIAIARLKRRIFYSESA